MKGHTWLLASLLFCLAIYAIFATDFFGNKKDGSLQVTERKHFKRIPDGQSGTTGGIGYAGTSRPGAVVRPFESAEHHGLSSHTGSIAASGQLSVDEIRVLHKQQEMEIRTRADENEVVISPSEKGWKGLTNQDIRSLHARQEQEILDLMKLNDGILAQGGNEQIIRTVSDLKALYEEQEREFSALAELDEELVTPEQGNDLPVMTLGEIRLLHRQQEEDMKTESDPYEIVIPASEDGSMAMTVKDLRQLHREQSGNLPLN